jgi:hypothetical protein
MFNAHRDGEDAMGDQAPGFAVDPAAVRRFARDLRQDLDEHLTPENDRILATFLDTPLFGTSSTSAPVRQAARDYARQLINLLDVVETLLYNGAVLSETAHHVADAYTTSGIAWSDGLSGLTPLAKTDVATAEAATTTTDGSKR